MTLKQAYDLFIFDRETYCASSTIRNYVHTLSIYIDFLEDRKGCSADKIELDSITKDDIKAYMLYLRKKPIYENHPFHKNVQGNMTKCSVRNYMVHVKAFMNFLYKEEYMETDVFRNFKMIRAEDKQIIPLTEKDMESIDNLFNVKTETGARNYCIFHLMIDAGLRSSEVRNLRIKDIGFADDLIFVSQGKGAKDRSIPLALKLKKVLYMYYTMYRPLADHSYLLCNVDGSRITEDTVKSLFARVKRKVKLERLYPHLLRHTFATSYILGGGDLESLRIFMGHTDISTTQQYLHIASQNQFNANIYKLDKRFFKRYATPQ